MKVDLQLMILQLHSQIIPKRVAVNSIILHSANFVNTSRTRLIRSRLIRSSTYSAIHKAAGLTVPGRSMILPGTIPETPISREWSRRRLCE